VVAFVWGVAALKFSVWPATALNEVYNYAFDKRFDTASFTERLQNDLGMTPFRLLTRDGGGGIGDGFRALPIDGLNPRRQVPQIKISPDRSDKLTFIYGVFDFTDGLHGAILLDETGQVTHRWTLKEDPDNLNAQPNVRLYPHGVIVDPDGAVTFIFDFGSTITKVDACGQYIWSGESGRDYNHTLSKDSDGNIWTLAGAPGKLDKIDPATGAVLRSISMNDVVANNPDIGIFSPRSDFIQKRFYWLHDPWHGNDIEPLPAHMAAAFPQFETDDLLISFRALNLLFVLNPHTLKVKWWAQGLTQQQHDPDWRADGKIMVFDNRWTNPPSKITLIDPATNRASTLLNGADYDFHSLNRGKVQKFGDDLLITSSKQGRVFEVDASGKIVFEFINTYDDGAGLRGLISEAIALPLNYFEGLPKCDTLSFPP